MPYDSDWQRRQRARWLRHDAHRWIRHDAARFVRPGFDPADVFPTLARKAKPAPLPTFDDELAAEIEDWRRVQAALQAGLNEVKAEMARRRTLDAKYSPTQPRVPAGNPRGGQWTDRNGGQGAAQSIGPDAGQGDLASLAQPMGNVDFGDVTGSSELGDLFQIRPSDTRTGGVQVAGDGYPVDLLQERALGGHAIEAHLRSRESVINDVRGTIDYARRNGDLTVDMRQSTFTSLEAANKLVNATISEHTDQVNRVVSGLSPRETLHSEFSSPTGFEAYARNERSAVVLSDTYAVRVVVVPDKRVAKGFRVDTAFPTNLRR
jgi:Bacterial CdiA-CT RNAse A domain